MPRPSLILVAFNISQSIEQMKQATDAVEDTSDYVRGEIARKKAIHSKDVVDLIKDEYKGYYQKAIDSSLAYDELALHGEKELEKVCHTPCCPGPVSFFLQQLAASTYPGTSISRLQTLQQSYLRTVIPLREKLAKVEANEAEQRRLLLSNFPMTVTDFLAIRDKAHQLHVCQFLMLEDTTPDKGELKSKREPTMSTYGWAWRQVTPLCEEYSKNVSPRFQRASHT